MVVKEAKNSSLVVVVSQEIDLKNELFIEVREVIKEDKKLQIKETRVGKKGRNEMDSVVR